MFHSMMYGGRMMGPYVRMGFYGGYPWVMGIACLALLLALVLSIIAIYRTSKKRSGKESSAHAIIAERFAKGEISREEFEQMKKDLR